MKYYSKKDWRVLLVVWIAILLPLTFGFLAIHIRSELALVISGWISLTIALLLILSLSALSFPLYYEIEVTVLRIRSGLLRQDIPLAAVLRSPLANLQSPRNWPRDASCSLSPREKRAEWATARERAGVRGSRRGLGSVT